MKIERGAMRNQPDNRTEDSNIVKKPAEQYFSAVPTSKDVRRHLLVSLRGHEVDVEVSNGVFASHRVDLGTSVLFRQAPQTPENGTFLDIGCGWGPITLAMALESPEAEVWALDVNERALDLTATNARNLGLDHVHTGIAAEIPADLTFDLIWSNPPIRVGKEELHILLMSWLPRLKVGGHAYLVVQKNLGGDSLIKWLNAELGEEFTVGKYASSKGYRIIEVSHNQ